MILDIAPARALEEIERGMGLSGDDLARALSVHARTLERWRSGESYPQREARRRLKTLTDIHRHLSESFRDTVAARQWLHDANRYLGWLTPIEALRAGRADRVEAALVALDSGIFI